MIINLYLLSLLFSTVLSVNCEKSHQQKQQAYTENITNVGFNNNCIEYWIRSANFWKGTISGNEILRSGRTRSLLPQRMLVNGFYKLLSRPQKNICQVGKVFGEHRWYPIGASTDGLKYICMDKLHSDVETNNCLVYSFGIADNWSFEESMIALGCTVRAFDPTIDGPPDRIRANKNLTFSKVGLFYISSIADENTIDIFGTKAEVTNLADAIIGHGDEDRNISILKVDVEGYEYLALPQWLDANILSQIDQIHLEIHDFRSEQENFDKLKMIESLDEFYDVYHFEVIYYEPNLFIERHRSKTNQYYTNFDLILYKSTHPNIS